MPSYPFYLNPSSQTVLAGPSLIFYLWFSYQIYRVFASCQDTRENFFQKNDLLSRRYHSKSLQGESIATRVPRPPEW